MLLCSTVPWVRISTPGAARAPFTLLRAALENSATAVWLLVAQVFSPNEPSPG